MNKITRSADGGPSSSEVAARAIGGGSVHVRGGNVADGERRAAGGRYEITSDRTDGLPIPADRAPEAHGGHYFRPEDFEKYSHAIGYDSGLAPGYDPTLELAGKGGDERGMYEIREWTPPGRETRVVLINRTHNDGALAMVGIYAVDLQGNVVKLPPNTVAIKAGWKWASKDDINQKNSAEEDRRKQDEERRKQAEKAPPAPPAPAPLPAQHESPEQRESRESRDPVLQAERTGKAPSDAERFLEARKDAPAPAARGPQHAAPDKDKK